MTRFVTSSTLSKTQAKSAVLGLFNIIIPFGQELLALNPNHPLNNSIQQLTTVRDAVKNDTPLQFPSVLDMKFLKRSNKLLC